MRCRLVDVATARSGDKGDTLDISLLAPDAETFAVLRAEVSAERVGRHFADIAKGPVERYELPRLWALKFVLHGALGGGAASSLRADNLGKTLGAALLRLEIDWPSEAPFPTTNRGEGS